ncbi:hypothetical protein N8A98_22290 [Devosia neptuniae]|uniref:Lipoprotein n=1 Tax=Devosia neptuniae TaxID=191302 RepID=A0ABY6CCD8_9HYPH|nr:hypothetical protein [Devosia neptuniae]UXN69903.1 hypothetical protein N8A98_22290 [Devosia neptuniae]
MNKIVSALFALPLLAFVAACTTTNTVPLTPDTFRLDTNASGVLFTGSAGSDTLLKAAQITAQRGYSHFRILDGASGSGTAYTGTSINRIGNTWLANSNYTPTQQVSVVVQMVNGPQNGAWSVAEVIANKGKMF